MFFGEMSECSAHFFFFKEKTELFVYFVVEPPEFFIYSGD